MNVSQQKRSIQSSQASWDDGHWLGFFSSDSDIVEGQHESEYSKKNNVCYHKRSFIIVQWWLRLTGKSTNTKGCCTGQP